MTTMFECIVLMLLLCQGAIAQAGSQCASLQQQNRKYTTSSSNRREYVLACAQNVYSGGDIATITTNTFADCMNACDTRSGCNAVAYWSWNRSCYLRGFANARALDLKSSADAQFAYLSSLTTCTAVTGDDSRLKFTETRQYSISCNSDLDGQGDLATVAAGSVIDCMKACDTTPDCTAASFHEGSNQCYLKAMLARTINPLPRNGPTIIYVTPPTTCKSLTAGGRRVKLLDQREYTLQCGADAPWQNDIRRVSAPSMVQCIQRCETESGCTAVAFWEGSQYCYLKGLTGSARFEGSSGADMAYLTSLNIGAGFPNKDQTGSWGSTIKFPVIPVAAAVIPNSNKVFVWSADYPEGFTNEKRTYFATMDLSTGQVSQQLVQNTGHNMFCPGSSFDVDGKLIVTGGTTDNVASVYDPASGSWSRAANMNVPRGYHSSTITSDGKIFTIGGSWSGGLGGKIGEAYNSRTNSWTRLPGCPTGPIETKDRGGIYRSDNHAWLFGWKNGAVFHAGPSRAMNWFGTSGSGSQQGAGTRGNSADAMCGNAVMYDAGKIVTIGGATSYDNTVGQAQAHLITLGDSNTTPQVQQASNMTYGRVFASSVVLPNGETFVSGGQGYGNLFTDHNPVYYPEMFSPATNSFRLLEAPMPIARTYHATAVLLPDATVFTGGGGLCGGGCRWNHLDANIYSPPYLFRGNAAATRPQITAVSTTTFAAGTRFTVTLGGLAYSSDATFAIVRAGSDTHNTNTDQRRLSLGVVSKSGNTYTLQLPSDYGIVNPGWWMLFAMDGGVPSVASWIRVRLN